MYVNRKQQKMMGRNGRRKKKEEQKEAPQVFPTETIIGGAPMESIEPVKQEPPKEQQPTQPIEPVKQEEPKPQPTEQQKGNAIGMATAVASVAVAMANKDNDPEQVVLELARASAVIQNIQQRKVDEDAMQDGRGYVRCNMSCCKCGKPTRSHVINNTVMCHECFLQHGPDMMISNGSSINMGATGITVK
jgi:hypothetical protein